MEEIASRTIKPKLFDNLPYLKKPDFKTKYDEERARIMVDICYSWLQVESLWKKWEYSQTHEQLH
jgi:hypothetical protein